MELATTVAVLLEAKAPYTSPNAFVLRTLPGFVEEMEADEAKVVDSNVMFVAAEAKTDRVERIDEEEKKLSATAATKQMDEECCQVLCSWLEVGARKMVAAQALAVMYRTIASGVEVDSEAKCAIPFTSPLDEMTKAYVGTNVARNFSISHLLVLWSFMSMACQTQRRKLDHTV